MKKYILSLLVLFVLVFSLFTLTGCLNSKKKKDVSWDKNSISERMKQNKNEAAANTAKNEVDGFDLTLTEIGAFKDMLFNYPKAGLISSMGTSTIINYVKNKETDEILFRILIAEFDNKSIADAMSGDKYKEVETKKYKDREWKVYSDVNNENNKTYATQYNGNTYAIGFVLNGNVGSLVDDFINSVSFK